MSEEERQEKEAHTVQIRQFLQATGCTLIEKYECQFKQDIRQDGELAKFVAEQCPQGRFKTTAEELLADVRTGKFFGIVECDIQVVV